MGLTVAPACAAPIAMLAPHSPIAALYPAGNLMPDGAWPKYFEVEVAVKSIQKLCFALGNIGRNGLLVD